MGITLYIWWGQALLKSNWPILNLVRTMITRPRCSRGCFTNTFITEPSLGAVYMEGLWFRLKFKKWLGKPAENLPPASWPCVRRLPPYYFYEILAVRDRFKPICSRVRLAAGPRAARESLNRATGLLVAILPIRAATTPIFGRIS